MSFGNKRLDRALDMHITQTPEEYYGHGTKELPEPKADKIKLYQTGVTFMAGTYSKRQGILLKVIQINGAWIVKDKNGVPKLVTEAKA